MNRLQIFFCLMAVLAYVFGLPSGCKGPVFKVNGVNYIRENLKENLNSAEFLSYDGSTNTIFFSYHSDEPVYTVLFGKFNLNNNEFETIDGLKYIGRTAVDAKTNNVYIQASGGFYKYNKNTNKPELYFAEDYNIAPYCFLLFAKSDIVYFMAGPKQTVYKIENGVASKVKDLETFKVKKLVIDDYDNMYYANDTGLYRQKIGSPETVYYKDSEGLVAGLAINQVGDVYTFAGFSGVYAVNRDTNVMEQVLDETVHGLTFDSGNNIVYSGYRNLFTLKPNNDPNCA